jgi:choline dehydrogenase-like flavoprotein
MATGGASHHDDRRHPSRNEEHDFDVIVIGSGFGGTMVAHALVGSGRRVLMLERGDWVPRGPHNWAPDGSVDLTRHYSMETPYRVLAGGNRDVMGSYSCVGGPSVFYGAVSMRFREADFRSTPEIVTDSGARWPYDYRELEPYYARAESILGIAGAAGEDPTEPPRTAPYPQPCGRLSETSRMIRGAAAGLGLRPFRLPLAINYADGNGRSPCVACTTCDTFACAVQAKNDLATAVLPGLMRSGLRLEPNTVVTKLVPEGNRVRRVECFDKKSDSRKTFTAKVVVLSAGALGSPHLLLASGLDRMNPGGRVVGRYLTRHCNAIAFGVFAGKPDPRNEFHKQIGIHDFYFGHPAVADPQGKLGSIQQVQTPPVGLVRAFLPRPLGHILSVAVPHMTGLLVMAEDQPRHRNHVAVNRSKPDGFGLPQLEVTHHYSKRDLAARGALLKQARSMLKRAGAAFCYTHKIKTFSHAVGTVRMGDDERTSALDSYCRFRGVDNLFVVDGSFMPTSGGLNPSLTISAQALRVGENIAEHFHDVS